jgi:hypothetical protein
VEKRFQVTEVRAVKNGDKRTIKGCAARYNVLSGDIPCGDENSVRERSGFTSGLPSGMDGTSSIRRDRGGAYLGFTFFASLGEIWTAS